MRTRAIFTKSVVVAPLPRLKPGRRVPRAGATTMRRTFRALPIIASPFWVAFVNCGGDASSQLSTAEDQTKSAEQPSVWCPDFSVYLGSTQLSGNPWNAIGYINNGCTAWRIDQFHIVTAAHCLSFENGKWQSPLRFYPQFRSGVSNPVRYDIDRGVAGTRSGRDSGDEPFGYMASDWAIAHLACSTTPPPGSTTFCPSASDPVLKMAHGHTGNYVAMAGYPRDYVLQQDLTGYCKSPPYTDEQGCGSPACCTWVANPQPPAPPLCSPQSGHACYSCNRWWNTGFSDPDCYVGPEEDGTNQFYLHTSCSSRGGNSGSPTVKWSASDNQYVAVSVQHGGLATCDDVACENQTDPPTYSSGGPGVQRFMSAPRFAGNVAVTTTANGQDGTALFATDLDRNRIPFRGRSDPSITAPWDLYFDYLGDSVGEPLHYERIAAMKLSNNRPRIVATANNGWQMKQFQVLDTFSIDWDYTWFDLPENYCVADIDAAYDVDNRPQLYAVQAYQGGQLWRISVTGNDPYAPWGAWTALTTRNLPDIYTRVTAIRRDGDGVQEAFMITGNGKIKYISLERFPLSWTYGFMGGLPNDVFAVDIDAAWDVDAIGMVFMVDSRGRLWTTKHTAPSGKLFGPWQQWQTNLYVPASAGGCPPAPDLNPPGNQPYLKIVSLTASRLQEPGAVIPVVFATDDMGNIYWTTKRAGNDGCGSSATPYWWAWRPFYHLRADDG